MTSFRVLVIGDACIDEYRYGEVRRLNPEAPVPILNQTHATKSVLGMAHNVAANLQLLGLNVDVAVPPALSKKIRYIDEKTGYHLLRVDEDVAAQPYVPEESYTQYDALVVSDYDKGFVEDSLVGQLSERFKRPIFVDTKKRLLWDYPNVFYKINELEESRLVSRPTQIVVTLGDEGCRYNGQVYPSNPVDVVDVCGAGDVFLAALTYGYLKHGDIASSLPIANRLAAISCQHMGAYTLTAEDVACVS